MQHINISISILNLFSALSRSISNALATLVSREEIAQNVYKNGRLASTVCCRLLHRAKQINEERNQIKVKVKVKVRYLM